MHDLTCPRYGLSILDVEDMHRLFSTFSITTDATAPVTIVMEVRTSSTHRLLNGPCISLSILTSQWPVLAAPGRVGRNYEQSGEKSVQD